MDLNRFTEKSQEALRSAQALAARHNHQGVDVEHLLTAMLEEPEGLATALLAATGYDPSYGARPLKRLLQREIETTLGRKLLAGDISEHSRVMVDWDGTNLTFTPYPLAEAA